jgi:hypothetical protein
MKKGKLFLSHPHAEGSKAVFFAHWLEAVFTGAIDVICTSEPEYRISPGHMVTTGLIDHVKSADVVLALITPESLKLPWIFYEMGAAHALEKVFVPCVGRDISLAKLPPQAFEYQGAELHSEEDLRRLVDALAHWLKIPAVPSPDYGVVATRFR